VIHGVSLSGSPLPVAQQRLAFGVRGLGIRDLSEEKASLEVPHCGTINRRGEEDSENNESKDPLQLGELDVELLQCKC
jgi:hypothetical protein